MGYQNRKQLYQELENSRNSKIIVYVTGDRPQLETQIHPESISMLVNHLDLIGRSNKISLYLYTRGGDTLAAWSIANLLYQYCNEYEVIIPSKALSAGTLICLGAKNLVMTKQATLGPIDPSITTPLNPQIPGAPINAKFPVSVEAINGFFDLAKSIGINNEDNLSQLFTTLVGNIHPLVLGQVFRTRAQIRMIGKRLLNHHISDQSKIDNILSFLCSESGSHDYSIYQQEAEKELGLHIESANEGDYKIIKSIFQDISTELLLTESYVPDLLIGTGDNAHYEFHRALIESTVGGSNIFRSKGNLNRRQIPGNNGLIQNVIEDLRYFEGWEYEPYKS